MHFVDLLYDYRVAMEFTPTGIHFPFFGNPVSLKFSMAFSHIVFEYRSDAKETKKKKKRKKCKTKLQHSIRVTHHFRKRHFRVNFLIGCSDKLVGVDFFFLGLG